MTNPNDMEILARRRVDLKEQADAIAAAIAAIDAQIVDAVEVGGVVAIGDEPVWRVQQRRTFDPDRARELVSPEVIAAATIPTLDTKVLRQLLPPALTDACMVPGRTFVAKARP